MRRLGHHALPREQQRALAAAIRWELITIAYTVVTIALVALVVGNSQAMRTAWIEDMLSLLPQLSFLVALLLIRRGPTRRFAFGFHRAMGVGHLVSGVALLTVGGNLAVEAVTGLLVGEPATIGTVRILGQTVWLGWLMVAVMSVIAIGPFVYGRAKLRLAPKLHNKVLYADADMATADWHTNVASVVGVLGIGVGLWWLDGVAALFISLGILWDGIRNTRTAVFDLIDQRARTVDDDDENPLIAELLARARAESWVRDAGLRIRDLGQVFHVEVFVVPRRGRMPTAGGFESLGQALVALDWRLQDLVVIPVSRIPDQATR